MKKFESNIQVNTQVELYFSSELFTVKTISEDRNHISVNGQRGWFKREDVKRYTNAKKNKKPAAEPAPAPEGERETGCMTDLLKRFNIPLDARKANKILVDSNVLLILTRKSLHDPDDLKNFKALSQRGLKYGKNVPSESHPVETYPVYYADLFPEFAKKCLGCEVSQSPSGDTEADQAAKKRTEFNKLDNRIYSVHGTRLEAFAMHALAGVCAASYGDEGQSHENLVSEAFNIAAIMCDEFNAERIKKDE